MDAHDGKVEVITEPSKLETIVFNFDGTENEAADACEFVEDESITNVLKLHQLLGGGLGEDGTCVGPGAETQRVFYHNGIGTREGSRMLPGVGWLVRGGNDCVVVFGYSRSAALARRFVSTNLRIGM